jgi:N-acetylneuraminic acid mutarotase
MDFEYFSEKYQNYMKRINISLFAIMLLAIVFSCTRSNLNYTQNGNWVGRATFSGFAMGYGASFVIGNSAYVGTGVNPLTPNQKLQTMFKYTAAAIPPATAEPYGYDSAYGSWTQIETFPGQARSNAVGFTIGGTGYLGSGLANDGFTALSDFYSYTPGSGWTLIDSLGDSTGTAPRFDAVSFGFDTTAYVLTGTNNYYYFLDVWRYSPTLNKWIQNPGMPGSQRSGAISFVYKSQGYLVTGYTPQSKWASGNSCYDFWKFTPKSDIDTTQWIRLHDVFNTNPGTFDDGYTNIVRRNGVGFVITGTTNGDCAYVTLGSNNGSDETFTWEYLFSEDLWDEKTPYEGTARTGAVGFTISNRGFVATGMNQGSTAAFSDCEEFFPNQVYNQYD